MTTVKYGYWTVEVDEEITTPWLKNRYVCSQCGNWQTYGRTPFCPNCGAKMTMTNGDKIRAMTDEELAEILPNKSMWNCPPDIKEKGGCPGKCVSCWLNWLKQEIKE